MTPALLPHDIHGTGEHRVLLLHGWFGDRTSFHGITGHLDEREFTYVLPDCRGYGEAVGIDGEFTIDEIATDAIELADALGWKSFSVVGHSMGGKVAQRLVTLIGGRVRKVVGITPVPASGSGFDDGTALTFAEAVRNPVVRSAIIESGTGGRLPRRWIDQMTRRSVERSVEPALASYLRSWSTEDFHRELAGSRVPALAILGRQDPGVSEETIRTTWVRWFENAELRVLPDAGHYPMEETPLALVALVERFLRRRPVAH